METQKGEATVSGQTPSSKKKARLFGQRSPEEEAQQNKSSESAILSAINSMKVELSNKISESEKRTTQTVAAKISSLEDKLAAKILVLEQKVEKLSTENKGLRDNNTILTNRLNQIDRDRRRNNIVITGTKVNTANEATQEVQRIAVQCAVEIPAINNIRLIKTAKRPKILITCTSFETKLKILKQRKEIKAESGEPIYLDDDLTPEDSRAQYLLRQEAMKLRKENKTVQIRGNRMMVDDEWWGVDVNSDTIYKMSNRNILQGKN